MKKFTENENFRKLMNRKIILGVSAILMAIAFIAITSFVPFIITREKLASEKFWTDEMIIIAITIFALVSVMFVGQASNAQNKDSELAKSKVEFKNSVVKILNINGFAQWVKKVLQPSDIQCVKERELRKLGIDDYTILYLEDAEIRALIGKPQKFEWHHGKESETRYYNQITEEQAEYIISLKLGVKKIKLVEPGYYLTVSSIDVDKTDSEKSGRESYKKTVKLIISIASKVLITLIPAMILAALARDLTQEGVDAAEAWATFFSRMFALLSSSFMGYMVGCQMNDIDADYIRLRVHVHERYLQDKDFKPLTQQEEARQEFIERVKKDNEDYTKQLGLDNNPIVHAPVLIKEE